jgi:hypothetical protein
VFGEFAHLLLNEISLASREILDNGSEDGIASVRAETETFVQLMQSVFSPAARPPTARLSAGF